MSEQRTLLGGSIGAISWCVGYFTTQVVGDGLSAASAYAVLAGWWLTAYTASVFQVPIKSVIPLAGIYFVFILIATLGGHTWFYRDAASLTLFPSLFIGVLQTIVIVSPILFNCVFVASVSWFGIACLPSCRAGQTRATTVIVRGKHPR